ncbi:MAG: hypothetical protein AAB692_01615 [Patescibacteria group bacterium]
MTIGALAKSISKKERRIVAALAALAALLTSIPPLSALMVASAGGQTWSGTQFLSPGDIGAYLSYIEQAKQGHWLFHNYFTTEALAPVLNIFWLAVGLAARFFQLDALLAYHLARLVLIPIFAAAAYAFISYIVPNVRHRLPAFAIFFFGSGIGEYASPFFFGSRFLGTGYEWPIDLWVAESNAFLTMLYSPHFIASWILFLAGFLLLLMAFENGRSGYALAAGLSALALFEFHPFHAPTFYAVPIAFGVLRTMWGERVRNLIRPYAIFTAVSAPAVLYHYYLTHYDENAGRLLLNNLTITPSPIHVLLGFGLVAVFAPAGYYLMRRSRGSNFGWDFLAAWSLTQMLLAYSPLTFQRRLLEGLQFPLTLLAVPAMIALAHRVESRLGLHKIIIAAFACLLLLPSTASALVNGVDVLKEPQPTFYFDRDTRAAFAWLKRYTPADAVVLALPDSGYEIAGWAGRQVYSGHWAMTIDAGRKYGELRRFFGSDGTSRRALIDASGASYIFRGPREREAGGDPSADNGLHKEFESGQIIIYRVIK